MLASHKKRHTLTLYSMTTGQGLPIGSEAHAMTEERGSGAGKAGPRDLGSMSSMVGVAGGGHCDHIPS